VRNTVVIFSFLFIIVHYVYLNPFSNGANYIQQTSITKSKKTLLNKSIKILPADFGNPYMSHYQFEQTDLQIWAISQDLDGEMILAHKQGIIIFNGKDWEQVKVPSVPIVLKSMDDQNLILIGCDNEYGYLQRNSKGVYEYHILSDKKGVRGDITDIKITDSYIYFFSDESLFRHTRKDLKLDKAWYAPEGNNQNGIIQIENDIYISIQNKGLYKLNSDGNKVYIPKSYAISQNQIAFSLPRSKGKVIVGTLKNNLFTFDGNKIEEFSTSAQKYISDSQLSSGIDLTNNVFAVSTITGGCIILNKKSGDIVNIVDIKAGLPDNEIYAIGKDNHGGLWLSHGFGISRVNYKLPVKEFNNYPGIEGNIIDVIVSRNKTYIATNQGVYYQDSIIQIKEIDNVKEKKRYTKKINLESEINKTNFINTEIKKEDEKGKNDNVKSNTVVKKNIFQRWRERIEARRKKKTGDLEKDSKEQEDLDKSVKEQVEKEVPKKGIIDEKANKDKNLSVNNKTKNVKAKTKVRSVSYLFRKIKNINGKCKQFAKYGDILLVTSNNGLYEINDKSSKIILKKNYINYILPSKSEGIFYIATDKGITAIKREKGKWVEYPKIQPKGFNDPVYTIAEDENMNIWVGNDNEVYYFVIDKDLSTISHKIYDFGNEYPEKFSIRQIDNSVFFLSARQIYRFNTNSDNIEKNNVLITNRLPYLRYIVSQHNVTWLQNEKGWVCVSGKLKPSLYQISLLNLFENIQNIYVDEKNNLWIVDGKNSLYKILSNNEISPEHEDFKVFLKRIKDDNGNLVSLDKINIGSGINSLTFSISAPYYLKPAGTTYQYFIKGIMNDWSEWNPSPDFAFFAQPGDYKIQVRAKNVLGEISRSKEYRIFINSPIWKKAWFKILSISLIILLLSLIVIILQKKRQRKLERDNKRLETKVEERTIEILQQKEQIESKNREITDSLNYASQIQSAILPPTEILRESLDEFFVFNRPKDIVSGDFYWANRRNDQLVVTAADCTGHGVPGAFLSLLGVTFLNEITNKMETLRANLILELLRERVIKSLNQSGYNKKRLDGIDLSLAVIDFSKMQLQFAGANNCIYLVRNGYLSEFRGNRMPIGLHAHRDKPFTNHDIEIKKGDIIYLFSDGYIDQFGGDYGRKFLSRNFKALLVEIFNLPLQEQTNILADILEGWKGQYDQIDDILIVGLKI
jgi:serine phosphatase RsbU (regulator of sigma subunit)/ligand-binding sensor domain-containing protein